MRTLGLHAEYRPLVSAEAAVPRLNPNTRYFLLGGAVLALAAAYSWYWFAMADRIVRGFDEWAVERRAEGMAVEYTGLAVTGFPLRMQPEADHLRLAAPGAEPAWEWRTAHLTANVLPYNLNHIVLTLQQPQDITLRVNGGEAQRYHFASANTRASLILSHGKIIRAALETREGVLSGGGLTAGPLALEHGQVHARLDMPVEENLDPRSPEPPKLLELALELENLTYEGFLKPVLGAKLTRLDFDGVIEGEAPTRPGIAGIREWRDTGGIAQIKKFDIGWGPLNLSAEGTLTLDGEDRLLGSMIAKLRGHEALIKSMQDAGKLDADAASAARVALGIIAMAAGATAGNASGAQDQKGEFSLPLNLQDGEMLLGPLRLAKLKPLF